MEQEEIVNPSMKSIEKKKCYTSPKIEAIASVREVTKGAGGGYSDGAAHQFNAPPSDPNG